MLKEKKLSRYLVSDVRFIHTQLPVTIKADDSICSILKAGILEKRCRNIYVVDANDILLGVIRIKNMLRNLFPVTSITSGISDGLNSLAALTADTAGKLMIEALYVIESTPLNKVASILIKENLLELPVVDDNNKIIGQVDASEIISFSMTYNK
ncbi:MAG: CBS domain-containing protein [Victivallales bacterium]|nr:CBS domain-containing protein [Victivallales bacterium]